MQRASSPKAGQRAEAGGGLEGWRLEARGAANSPSLGGWSKPQLVLVGAWLKDECCRTRCLTTVTQAQAVSTSFVTRLRDESCRTCCLTRVTQAQAVGGEAGGDLAEG